MKLGVSLPFVATLGNPWNIALVPHLCHNQLIISSLHIESDRKKRSINLQMVLTSGCKQLKEMKLNTHSRPVIINISHASLIYGWFIIDFRLIILIVQSLLPISESLIWKNFGSPNPNVKKIVFYAGYMQVTYMQESVLCKRNKGYQIRLYAYIKY